MSASEEEIALAIAGDRAAVTALVRRFLPRVFGLCRRIAGRDLADEATQETFVRALRALPRLRESARFTSWLLTIAANTARELSRRRERERPLEVEPVDAREAPETDARSALLERAIGRLEPDDREVFLLHVVEEVPIDDLAREKGGHRRGHEVARSPRAHARPRARRAGGRPWSLTTWTRASRPSRRPRVSRRRSSRGSSARG